MKYLPYIFAIIAIFSLFMAYRSNQRLKSLEAAVGGSKKPCGCSGDSSPDVLGNDFTSEEEVVGAGWDRDLSAVTI